MNWLKYKIFYFSVSLFFIVISVYSLTQNGLRFGIDFTGGTLTEYSFSDDISTEETITKIREAGFEVSSIQQTADGSYLFRLPSVTSEQKIELEGIIESLHDGEVTQLRFETVGPSIGPDLVKKTVYAIIFAAIVILLWVAYQFKNITFGMSAILAMFHDSFILVGSFSLLGFYYGAEVDFLFITALLTTLSFSVHDTIVVFDRIRELQKTYSKKNYTFASLANRALTETMVRSLNNSFTIMFMLVALLLLGGLTIKWFATALLIGTVLGTYSSPFVAVPLLVTIKEKFKK